MVKFIAFQVLEVYLFHKSNSTCLEFISRSVKNSVSIIWAAPSYSLLPSHHFSQEKEKVPFFVLCNILIGFFFLEQALGDELLTQLFIRAVYKTLSPNNGVLFLRGILMNKIYSTSLCKYTYKLFYLQLDKQVSPHKSVA